MIHDAAATGYSDDSERYHRARPGYHPDVVELVANRYGAGTVVELGAGTGIFTRQLVDNGVDVIAFEPVVSMRRTLKKTVPEADVRVGSAENMSLADDSVDTVVAAQAFHWFDHDVAIPEMIRAIRLGGHIVTVWNVRDHSVGWVRECSSIIERYAGDTPRHRTMQWRKALNAEPLLQAVDEWRVPNPQPMSAADAVDRVLSTSFIAALPEEEHKAVADEIWDVIEPIGRSV
ncbi:MAG: methyltransferase domain-containing protein, partial [Actinomycetota bacterium]